MEVTIKSYLYSTSGAHLYEHDFFFNKSVGNSADSRHHQQVRLGGLSEQEAIVIEVHFQSNSERSQVSCSEMRHSCLSDLVRVDRLVQKIAGAGVQRAADLNWDSF